MTKPAMNRMFLDITKKNEDDEQGDAMEEGEGATKKRQQRGRGG